MQSFISKVVDDVIEKHNSLSNIIFVLPSQRACVFFKEAILASQKEAFFMPKIENIENFIQELADINLIDSTQLLFEFYSVYKQHSLNENKDSFDSFYQWAPKALADFNEIDSHLISSHHIFSNLSDVKKLDNWFQQSNPSKLASNYLKFFNELQTLYEALYDKLRNNKVGYQGLIYREATENLEFYINSNLNKHIVFIGFNALNRAEEFIFQEFLNREMSTIYWDADESFFNPFNEAGFFLNKYKSEWNYYKENPFLWIDLADFNTKKIKIIGAPKSTTQIKYIGELLESQEKLSSTCYVLADENLLPLAINSLPKNVENINITMGYPLKNIPISNFIQSVFKLHLNQQKFNKKELGQFYYKDVLKVFNNAYLNKRNGMLFQKISVEIKKGNYIFLSFKDIEELVFLEEQNELNFIRPLFHFSESIQSIINCFIDILQSLKDVVEGIEKEYIYRFYMLFKQLETLNSTYHHLSDLKTFFLVFQSILRTESLSFQGEPLQGLQLMGMLETRALDFETVIISSVNEGVLPNSKNNSSFIPFDIKKHFNMPTYQEKDAIFSYHFQRLLLRAKNIYLIYSTETDNYGSGEKSRFLTQLLVRFPLIEKLIVGSIVTPNESQLMEISKTDDIILKLKELVIKGLSPSKIATYIYNPIRFYEQHILEIKEEDEVEETIAANTMGTIIHEVLETLYKPHINKFVSIEKIEDMQLQIDALLKINFKQYYKKGAYNSGKNKLIFEVCKNHISRFLIMEKQLLKQGKQLKIIALEAPLSVDISIKGIADPIKFKGIVDRIDELDGVTRIIDYKTGKVIDRDLKMADFSVMGTDYKYTKALQVMLYAYMYASQKNGNISDFEAGVISFKNLNNGFLKMNFSEKNGVKDHVISEEKLTEFIDSLSVIIEEILNPTIPFKEKENLPF
ncbi:PD-(D/E)XK nuclease family protein [Lutibacter sp.]|uniref:PD-(D/E)XK nuclease family protein n=1 Tax=Lutibacter sp. TaxID=1925666 RepID=UPI002732C500|nr:PD-(D/E)XK nuclease family protein [Lutibacter sp.]MDP3314315.1 PD-(D/E)XK nuclease family protein [Lutibacter sp.]